jgi:hypothetical protein
MFSPSVKRGNNIREDTEVRRWRGKKFILPALPCWTNDHKTAARWSLKVLGRGSNNRGCFHSASRRSRPVRKLYECGKGSSGQGSGIVLVSPNNQKNCFRPPFPLTVALATLLPTRCSHFFPFTQIYNYINHPNHHAVKPRLRLECRWAQNANRWYCIVYSAAHSRTKHPKIFPQPYQFEAET